MRHKSLILLLLCLIWSVAVVAQEADPGAVDSAAAVSIRPPAPVTDLQAEDQENDHGHAIVLSWTKSADDVDGGTITPIIGYQAYRWRPHFAWRVDTLRQMLSMVRAGLPTNAIFTRDAKMARAQVEAGILNPDSLAFVPDLPAYDPETGPTAEILLAALNAAIVDMETKFEYTKDSLRTFQRTFLDSVEQLPQAYADYPENGEWVPVAAMQPPGVTSVDHIGAKEKESSDYSPDFTGFYYRVHTLTMDPQIEAISEVIGPVESYGQWYNSGRTPVLVAVLLFGLGTLLFVRAARKGQELYVRPLGGIEAVDEAIGRATEMGKPILYVLGLGTASDVATIASFTILGRVAKRVAEYQTQLIVPTYDPIVMSVAQEVVKSSYMDAGRPDEYNEDMVFFVTQMQFAYVAAVNGIMLRELPATNVYMGKFFAESLLMAETGAVAGSIQIAGTDEIAQIPFFIVACDYTLIGEELYAASAYLGREPILLGSLKAQDWAKAAILILAVLGTIAAHADWVWFTSKFVVEG